MRYYFADYFLNEMKDPRSPTYTECECFRNKQRTGIVDYFIRLCGKWIPVEAKLNIATEEDIFLQIAKYIHIESFITPEGNSIDTDDFPFCLVIDQAGLGVIRDTEFIECSDSSPLFRRDNCNRSNIPRIRDYIIKLLRLV